MRGMGGGRVGPLLEYGLSYVLVGAPKIRNLEIELILNVGKCRRM